MKRFQGEVKILRLIEGAKMAEGLTVIIDVFRAFSLECYLYDMGVKAIRPVGTVDKVIVVAGMNKVVPTVEEAFALREQIPESLLVGERHGQKCEEFDYGNSPSTVGAETVKGKTVIHTTSAGTQGIVNAKGASEIITGSLVNASAVAEYILEKQPQTVSLVCMGNAGIRPAAEDELCAEYIKSILYGEEMQDIAQRAEALQLHGGEHFFDKERQHIYPQDDFWMCIRYNRFPFVLRVEQDETGFISRVVKG